MALIKCPECGKLISDKAKSCPECGCPKECFPPAFTFCENEDGTIGITGINDDFCNNFLSIPDCDDKSRKITTIEANAFEGKNIESVKFGKNIYLVKKDAFKDCANLHDFYCDSLEDWFRIAFDPDAFSYSTRKYDELISLMSNKKRLYVKGEHIKDLVIPKDVEIIPSCSLCDFDIESVTFHSNMREIQVGAFAGCKLLKAINIESLESWCKIKFDCNHDVFDNGAKIMINGTYSDELHFSGNIKSIPEYAFRWCGSIKLVEFDETIEKIENGAFEFCHCLTDVIFHEGLKYIGNWAFECCFIRQVSFPSTVKEIGHEAFYFNRLLESIQAQNFYNGASFDDLGKMVFGIFCDWEVECPYYLHLGNRSFRICPVVPPGEDNFKEIYKSESS